MRHPNKGGGDKAPYHDGGSNGAVRTALFPARERTFPRLSYPDDRL